MLHVWISSYDFYGLTNILPWRHQRACQEHVLQESAVRRQEEPPEIIALRYFFIKLKKSYTYVYVCMS